MRSFFVFLVLSIASILQANNPFLIVFPEIEEMSRQDYVLLQKRLRAIPKKPIEAILAMHPNPKFPGGASRAYNGVNLGIINESKGLLPIQNLQKMGQGGSRCIVSYASYNRNYPEMIERVRQALEESGFDGYFYYRIGGFPNLTGREMQYAGVPYSFKIYMMQEAEKMGFNTVLWIDSAVYPLKNPAPLFESIEKKGYLLHGWRIDSKDTDKTVSPAAKESLQMLSGREVLYSNYIQANIFGLKMDTPLAQQFIYWFNRALDIGLPFVGWYPEEPLIATLVAWLAPHWQPYHEYLNLRGGDGTQEDIEQMKQKRKGYFYTLPH